MMNIFKKYKEGEDTDLKGTEGRKDHYIQRTGGRE